MPADMHIFGQAKIDTLSRQNYQLSRAGKGLRGKLLASRIGGEFWDRAERGKATPTTSRIVSVGFSCACGGGGLSACLLLDLYL